MENHGVLMSGEDARECLALHEDWVMRCERYFAEKAPKLAGPPAIGSAELRAIMGQLRKAWREANGGHPFLRYSEDMELAGAACGEGAGILSQGALTPDHIVYAGGRAVYAASLEELPALVRQRLVEKSPLRVALVKDRGAFVMASDAAKLDAAEALAIAGARIARLAAGAGGARNLSSRRGGFHR